MYFNQNVSLLNSKIYFDCISLLWMPFLDCLLIFNPMNMTQFSNDMLIYISAAPKMCKEIHKIIIKKH